MSPFRRSIFVLAVGFVSLLVQQTLKYFLPSLHFGTPNLLLCIAVFLAFFEANLLGATLTFTLGLLLDLSSGVILGPWAGAFSLVFGVLSAISQRLFIESGVAAAAAGLVASLSALAVFTALNYDSEGGSAFSIVAGIIIESIVTAGCTPIVFALLRPQYKRRGVR